VATQAGLKAYALHQADLHDNLRAFYFDELSLPLGQAAAALTLDEGDLPALFAQRYASIIFVRELLNSRGLVSA
jgi:hypothetical protein